MEVLTLRWGAYVRGSARVRPPTKVTSNILLSSSENLLVTIYLGAWVEFKVVRLRFHLQIDEFFH